MIGNEQGVFKNPEYARLVGEKNVNYETIRNKIEKVREDYIT